MRNVSPEGIVINFWRRALTLLSIPLILRTYFDVETGSAYGVGRWTKISIVRKMARNNRRIVTASHFLEHLIMATQILRIPPSVNGSVVECGSFKGGSAANLSLVCDLCNRKLEIFDSFAGLPHPSASDTSHSLVNLQEIHTYGKGAYRGALPEVQGNITRYGKIAACHFNVGYFQDTLPLFSDQCVMVFLDVDLVDSLKTCFTYLWPLLQDGGYLFTHEAHHMEIADLFFDKDWWGAKMGSRAPGLIGAGTGLGLLPSAGGYGSALGYTIKNASTETFDRKIG